MDVERREFPRDEVTDLDFTWHGAVRALHKRMDDHFTEAAGFAADIEVLKHNQEGLKEQLEAMGKTMTEITNIKTQAEGGIRLLLFIGTLVGMAAAAYGWLVTHMNISLRQ